MIFKESAQAGWPTRSTRTATPTCRASNLGGDPGARGTGDLDPGKWSHLAATYDGDDPAAVRQRHPGRLAHAPRGPRRQLRRSADASAATTSGASTSDGLIDEVRVYSRAAERGRDRAPTWASRWCPARRRRPADPGPDAIGSFAAPKPWPIVPVHLALHLERPGGGLGRLRGRAQLRAPLGPGDRDVPAASPPGATCSAPATSRCGDGRLRGLRRPRAGLRGHQGHEPLQPADGHLAARRRHERGALVPDRDRAAGRPRVRDLGRRHHAQGPGPERAADGRVQHAAVDLRPEGRHAGPTCPRPRGGCRSTRSCSCCRTASCSTPARTPPRARSTSTRSSGRPSARARSTATARSCTGPARS